MQEKFAEANPTRPNEQNRLKICQEGAVPGSQRTSGLSKADGNRPDGASLIPMTRGKPLVLDIITPDIFANSHIGVTSTRATVAAHRAAAKQRQNNTELVKTSTLFRVHRNQDG